MRISDWSSDVCSSDLPVHLRHGLASRLARGSVPGNGHRRIAVIALELLRARCPFNLCKRAEGHHFAGCISNLEVEHVLWRHSVSCFGLQEHPQDPPFTVEVIGICAAESDRERSVNFANREAEGASLKPVAHDPPRRERE